MKRALGNPGISIPIGSIQAALSSELYSAFNSVKIQSPQERLKFRDNGAAQIAVLGKAAAKRGCAEPWDWKNSFIATGFSFGFGFVPLWQQLRAGSSFPASPREPQVGFVVLCAL